MKRGFAHPVRLLLWLGGLLLLPIQPLCAHGDLHERIQVLNARLAIATNDAALLVQRAELHREHHDWLAAAVDLDQAQLIDPGLKRIDFFRARLARDMGDVTKAQAYLDRLLTSVTNDVEAIILRARVRAARGDAAGAVADYSQAIALSREPQPEWVLERADLLAAQGQGAAALRGLDEGVARLGDLIVLQTRALDLELARTNYSGALERLEAILRSAPRREIWLARQGDVLHLAGREAEARSAWREAIKAIDALPERWRTAEAMLALRQRISGELARNTDEPIKPVPAR